MTHKFELVSLWVGSILAAITSSSMPVILSCLASTSIIIANRKQIIEFIKELLKKK
jgi:hypothetical protein